MVNGYWVGPDEHHLPLQPLHQYEEEDDRSEESQWEYGQILIASTKKHQIYWQI